MLQISGAYIYRIEEKLGLFIFKKLSKEELQEALPLTYVPGNTHLVAYFIDGLDYVGASTEDRIRQELVSKQMKSIHDTAVYDLGLQNDVQKLITFAEEQLKL